MTAGLLVLAPLVVSLAFGDDPLEGLPPAYEGAVEGGDPTVNNPISEDEQRRGGGFDLPSGGFPSPLFGARDFSQRMLRFEEFGTEPVPAAYAPSGGTLPAPDSAQAVPDPSALDAFLRQPLWPEPARLSNTAMENPWRREVEQFLGRTLDTPPMEGRPGGEGWAHQRFEEFAPQCWFQSAQAGARTNLGMRDSRQLHGYALGEFGPGGLYHNTAGAPGFEGTTSGLEIRVHPNMPIQDPLSVWTFDGTLPPKLLMARVGEPILFRHYNALPIDPAANRGFGLHTITTHEHNGHHPAESDGFANAFFFPGQYYDYRWPMQLAGHDSCNVEATDPRAGRPDDQGGTINLRGDWRETMSTHWFHDHMLDFTASNVYKGNAAMMNYYSSLDRGNEAIDDGVNLRLPSGTALSWGNRDYDVNLLVADKAWTRDGQLWLNIFNKDGFVGDRMTVNWLYKPYFDVRSRRYRFRILNGSVARYFKLALVDESGRPVPFHMVANDGNLMGHAIPMDGTNGTQVGVLPTQAIGERYDIVVDFSGHAPGSRLYLVNLIEHANGKRPNDVISLADAFGGGYGARARDDDGDGQLDRWVDGDPCVGRILEFRVQAYAGTDLSMDPADFEPGRRELKPQPMPTAQELANARHRTFSFGRSSGTDSAPWTIKTDGGGGFTADPRRISAAPQLSVADGTNLGTLEIWRFENGGGGWSHPIHVHFEESIPLSRDDGPLPIWERYAQKDIYRIGNEPEASTVVEVAIRFREFAGTYVEHCHNTTHEDHAMLLRYDIERPGQFVAMPAPIPTWDGVEFVDSVALPTARTGDGFGPGDR